MSTLYQKYYANLSEAIAFLFALASSLRHNEKNTKTEKEEHHLELVAVSQQGLLVYIDLETNTLHIAFEPIELDQGDLLDIMKQFDCRDITREKLLFPSIQNMQQQLPNFLA